MLKSFKMKKLEQKYFLQDALFVAKDLIGKFLVLHSENKYLMFMITETEAYGGTDDDAAHSYRGKTQRNSPMFSEGGALYVFHIYGLYYCMNIVCGSKDDPQAVLIRGLKPVNNFDIISENRYHKKYNRLAKYQKNHLTDGPGKICQALKMDKKDNNRSITSEDLYIVECTKKGNLSIKIGPRINIDYAEISRDFPYRFLLVEK